MKIHTCALVPVLISFAASVANAQSQVWIRQFGTSVDDWAQAAAADGAGGVYIGGQTAGALGTSPSAGMDDAWIARYNQNGNRLWIQQFGTSSADYTSAAAANGTSFFAAGGTEGNLAGQAAGAVDVWVAQFDSAGSPLWTRQFGSSAIDNAHATAADGTGGVYVGGGTEGDLSGPNAGIFGTDAWLARYDSTGTQLWIAQLGTSDSDDIWAAAADGTAGVYVGGTTEGTLGGPSSGGADAWLARFDGSGGVLWIRQFGSSEQDALLAAVPDGTGGVFVSGETRGSLGPPNAGSRDAWLARYDSSGTALWIVQFGTTGSDSVLGASMDGAGGVHLTGSTGGSLGGASAGNRDAWLARYDDGGDQLWIQQLGTSSNESGHASASDGAGGVYVTGQVDGGSLGGPSSGLSDAWLARYVDGLGMSYCGPAIPNSTGLAAVISVTGSAVVVNNDVELTADQLPPGQFGYFLAGQTQGFFNPPASQGVICLSGNIGRYNQVANIIQGPTGTIQIDLTAIPVNPSQSVLPGETWNFQCWFRDNNPTLTSNFTDAVSVTFQ